MRGRREWTVGSVEYYIAENRPESHKTLDRIMGVIVSRDLREALLVLLFSL